MRRAPRRGYGASKASWVAYLTSGRAWGSTSDRGWRLSPTSHLEGLEGPYPGGRWVCKAVTLLTPCLFYPLDFRTDPGTGANPRPAWLPGAERRCSVSGALWKSMACAHGAGRGGGKVSLWDTRSRNPFKSCPVSPSCLFLSSVWLPACHIVSFQ